MLGYSFLENEIKPYMEKLKILRDEHNAAILKALRGLGIEICYEDLGSQSGKKVITRLNFAKALTQKGYTETVGEALDKYLHKGGTAYVEYNNHAFSVVAKVIHDAGGIVALAHPAEYGLNDTETANLVVSLKKEGLDAIECIHPSQSVIYSHKMMNLAKQNNLSLTGGSDFHGKNDEGIDLGMGGEDMLIPESFLWDII